MIIDYEALNKLPSLYSQDAVGVDVIAYLRFYCPGEPKEWLALEGGRIMDGGQIDFMFYGYVGEKRKRDYFRLSQLIDVPGIEMDCNWKPCILREVLAGSF